MKPSVILDSQWFENAMGWLVILVMFGSVALVCVLVVVMFWPSDGDRNRSVYRESDGRCYVLDSRYVGTTPILVGKVIVQQRNYLSTRRYLSASACDEVAP